MDGVAELCTALAQHGMTAEPAVVREVTRSLCVPVMAMLRPSAGSFVITNADLSAMLRVGEALLNAGAHDLVFGVLRPGRINDVVACRQLLRMSKARTSH